MYIKSNKSLKGKNPFKKLSFYFFLLVFSISSLSANAQCAMCRAALTSEGNATQAAAVNDGIVYLMVIPYILVAGIGYAIYRMKKNKS
jgi:hypothetical protein